jgi:hypothetical protein
MGMARNALLGLEFLGYLLVVSGILLPDPVQAVTTNPPVGPIAVVTVGFVVVASVTAFVAP